MKVRTRIAGAVLAGFLLFPMGCQAASVDRSHFAVELAPASQGNPEVIPDETVKLTVDLESDHFEHDTTIPLSVNLADNARGWNAALEGEALVYNQKNQIVLFGMVSGYNGDMTTENFLSVNFTYDVKTGTAIANVTYDIQTPANKRLELGENTDLFTAAYNYLSDKMMNAHNKQTAGKIKKALPGVTVAVNHYINMITLLMAI